MLFIWMGFIAVVLVMLALDLGVFHRKAHVVSVKEALIWSGVWATMGLSFSIFVYYGYENHWLGLGAHVDPADGLVNNGMSAMVKYITGYVVEKSLSVDNIFVIAMIMGFFAVPALYQHRVLFWGILGALVMRGIMIALGAKLIAEFHWVLYVFAVFLILTGIKMLVMKDNETDPGKNILVRWAQRFFPVTSGFHGDHFFVRAGSEWASETAYPGAPRLADAALSKVKTGTLMLTPLMLALIVVEFSDVIFAVDSIPAIFAITADPFLVFTSNVFAILGLRALYFALAGMIEKFRFLKLSVASVLILVGVKMIFAGKLKEMLGQYFNIYLLAVILLMLAAGVVGSIVFPAREEQPGEDG